MIKGIYADEAYLLHPEQWLNVYEIDVCGKANFYCTCQVKDLEGELNGSLDEYGLELIEEEEI